MRRGSGAMWWRSAEFVYASSALFVLTQGPVYRLWSPSAGEAGRLPEPSVSQVYLVTFLLVQLPGVALFFRRVESTWLKDRCATALTAFVTWLGLTVLWSTFARQSLPEFLAIVFTTAFGLYVASSFSVREVWIVVMSSMALGVGASWIAVIRLWEGAVNFQEGYWTGIYYNRNSLAPVAAVAIIGIIGVVLTSFDQRTGLAARRRLVAAVALSVLLGFSIIELWQSKSKTSPIALAVAVVSGLVWLALRAASDRLPSLKRFKNHTLHLTIVVFGSVLFVALRVAGSSGALPSNLATLSSRRALWSLSWDGVLEKPLLGWGWMAAWRTPEFFRSGDWWAVWNSVWSHNGYHDVLLGGGIVAGVLFLLFFWFGFAKVARRELRIAVPQVLLIIFVLVASTQESFFLGSHFSWALVTAMMFTSRIDAVHPMRSTPAK